MFEGEVNPLSMTRRPGSACRRLRMVDHAPEWRGTLGPDKPGPSPEGAASCFFSNQRLNNPDSPCGQSHLLPGRPMRLLGMDNAARRDGWSFRSFSRALSQVDFAAEQGVVFNGETKR